MCAARRGWLGTGGRAQISKATEVGCVLAELPACGCEGDQRRGDGDGGACLHHRHGWRQRLGLLVAASHERIESELETNHLNDVRKREQLLCVGVQPVDIGELRSARAHVHSNNRMCR